MGCTDGRYEGITEGVNDGFKGGMINVDGENDGCLILVGCSEAANDNVIGMIEGVTL